MGYFLFIDGKKYDRSILDAANAVLEGKTVNKFNIKDAERIYGVFLVEGEVSAVTRRTLNYLLENHPWTPRAKSWLQEELAAVPVSDIEKAEIIIQEEFGLHHLNFDIDKVFLAHQSELTSNKVFFEDALRQAINNFLKYSSHETAVVKVLAKHYDLPSIQNEFQVLLDGIIKEHLKHATLTLIPQFADSTSTTKPYQFPVEGELVRRNWVFGLSFHDLPDYYFWAIIDREGEKPTYNYGSIIELPVFHNAI